MNLNTGYAKIVISGTLEVLTGLHIGGGGGFSAIGAADKPVIRDPLSGLPLIPGTSLKGKMRSLLARQVGADTGKFANRPNNDDAVIRRVFGDTEQYMTGRLVFRDSVLSNWPELDEKGARTPTEVKFENSINRVTAVANPRQIERVIRGSKFALELVYEIAHDSADSADNVALPTEAEIAEDFDLIARGLRLLELDYLGGSGTRGYGRVQFENVHAKVAVGNVNSALLENLNGKLQTL
jgi:CRISPR-associated protein Csm3